MRRNVLQIAVAVGLLFGLLWITGQEPDKQALHQTASKETPQVPNIFGWMLFMDKR